MKILDLFCKAGGASMGMHNAYPNAEIVGVDIKPQPRYPFNFILADAVTFDLSKFDFIWASPPCQAHTVLKGAAWDKEAYKAKHIDLIPAIRKKLKKSGKQYIIENVMGAPLLNPVILCGSFFDLKTPCGAQLRRHRQFECSFDPGFSTSCNHSTVTIGVFGNKARNTALEKQHYSKDKNTRGPPPKGILFSIEDARHAMGTPWMNMNEMSEAIPPIYAEYLLNIYKEKQ